MLNIHYETNEKLIYKNIKSIKIDKIDLYMFTIYSTT